MTIKRHHIRKGNGNYMKNRITIGISLLVLLAVSALSVTVRAANVTQAQIQDIKHELADIKTQKAEVDARLAIIQNDLSKARESMKLIESQVLFTETEINTSQMLLDEYDRQIEEKEEEIWSLEAQEEEQLQEFYRQVRWMEETGSASFLSILFRASSFSELLDYSTLITSIMEYSNRIIERLQTTQAELETARNDLQMSRDGQAEVRMELEMRNLELDAKRIEQQRLLQQIAASESEVAAEAKKLADSESQINKELKEAEQRFAAQLAALAAQQQANNTTVNATSGDWYWPLPGRYTITSYFGPRLLHGRWESHTGTDIPAPSGTPIYAANDGVVTTVNRNANASSYGYYCTINHGNGYVTLYAHQCQVPIVKEGELISKGQVIGYVGTTGNSTGNHLHFELRVNGVRDDVLKLYPNLDFVDRS